MHRAHFLTGVLMPLSDILYILCHRIVDYSQSQQHSSITAAAFRKSLLHSYIIFLESSFPIAIQHVLQATYILYTVKITKISIDLLTFSRAIMRFLLENNIYL